MLKKTITYEDLDGNECTEEFYFNLNKAEVVELEHSVKGGLSDHLLAIVKSEDGGAFLAFFKDFIMRTYGRRSADGKHFLKSKEMAEEFIMSGAYPELFMELATDADAMVKFIEGTLPESLRGQVQKQKEKQISENPTRKELTEMSKDELLEAMKRMSENKVS